MFTRSISIVLCLFDFIVSEMEPFVVGGDYGSIYRFPHSTFLGINCVTKNKEENYWICGGSIINQAIVLTAAHCMAGCASETYIGVTVGHEDKDKGISSSTHSFLIHEDYDPVTTTKDIALLRLNTMLSFSSTVRRVALMKDPPYNEVATVAGWGLIDEENKVTTNLLKYTEQVVWPHEQCKERIKSVLEGCFCAASKKKINYASRGDSGSALLVRDYIQIGLVSYKVPAIAKNLIIYTDVGYYYDWILNNSELIFCEGNK